MKRVTIQMLTGRVEELERQVKALQDAQLGQNFTLTLDPPPEGTPPDGTRYTQVDDGRHITLSGAPAPQQDDRQPGGLV